MLLICIWCITLLVLMFLYIFSFYFLCFVVNLERKKKKKCYYLIIEKKIKINMWRYLHNTSSYICAEVISYVCYVSLLLCLNKNQFDNQTQAWNASPVSDWIISILELLMRSFFKQIKWVGHILSPLFFVVLLSKSYTLCLIKSSF